ncbi:MAG: hypothetical protein M3Y77_14375 [Actinomycetota bacterium]|nr:hypothetical protein [Actinomycetota bacterium]
MTPGHLADAGGSSSVLISSAALAALSPMAGTIATWAMLPAAADAGAVNSALQQATASHSSIQVTGTAEQRASTDGTLRTMLTQATALLAVAVVIAVVGIGNTLGLSVLALSLTAGLLASVLPARRAARVQPAAALAEVG